MDGPRDYTDRFTYWVARVGRGGEVLAPGRPERNVQFIDARDVAEWIIDMAERGGTGVFNATGSPITMRTLLETCRDATGSDASSWQSLSGEPLRAGLTADREQRLLREILAQ